MAELIVQIIEVAEGPAEEEVLADVAERPFDLALGLGPIGPAGARLEAVMAGEIDKRAIVDDALNPWLVGELDVELGEVDLRLLAGRRLEAHFESGGADGAKIARAIAHDAVAAGEAALLDLSP